MTLLEVCDRVRSHYHALVGANALPALAAWVGSSPIDAAWRDAIAGRGTLAAWLLSTDGPDAWMGPPLEPLLASAPLPRLHAIGYWHAEYARGLPKPVITRTIDRGIKKQVVRHLRGGAAWASWLGYSWCRICGMSNAEMGCSDLSDGVWIWPEGLAHYVERHDLDLPPAFLDHIRSGETMAQARRTLLQAVHPSSDHSRWLAWAAEIGAGGMEPAPAARLGWWVTSHDTRGPFTDDELVAEIRAGRVQAYHRLWKLGLGPERKAREFPAFAPLLPPPPRL